MAQPQQRVDYPKRKSGEMQWRHYNMRRIKIEQRQASMERCLDGDRGRARLWFPWFAQASIIFWRWFAVALVVPLPPVGGRGLPLGLR